MNKWAIGVVVLIAATLNIYAGSVTNTVKWNVPWGDRYRERNIETLDAYETEINSLADGEFAGNVTVSGAITSATLAVTSSSTLPAHDIAVGELPAMTTGQILVGDTTDSNANVAAMSGDATIASDGALTIAARAVEASMLPAMITGQILVGDTTDSNANVVAMSGVTVDATGAASVASSAINSGDIASDRMTANGVVVTDFTQNGGILVGTGAGTFAEETGATLRTSIDCPANSQVFGSADITIGDIASAQVITTNTIAMLDTAGVAKAGEALIEVWISETAYGLASTNNIESLTLSGGTAVRTVLPNGAYIYVVGTNGQATATITGTADGTNYLNVSVGANVSSEAIVLIP